MLDRAQRLAIVALAHQVEETIVPLGIDEAGARPLKLVAHAARAPDLHVEILGEAVDRAGDRLAQPPAAIARRRRIGDDIDRHRDHPARPGVGLAEHQAQRHGQAMVDIHFVDDGHVEFVEDQALGDMPGQVRLADHVGHRARPPALVGRLVAFATADREGRDDLHVEGGGMVIIDQDHDIGLFLRDPLPRPVIAGEQRLPIRLGGLLEVHGSADGGHMAGGDAGSDAGHQRFSLMERTP